MVFLWLKKQYKWAWNKIEGREVLKKTLGNVTWMMGEQVVRLIVGLLVGVWLARYLGPELFGLFNYAIAFTMLVSPLALMGLDNIAFRDLVRTPLEHNEILGTSFLIILAGGTLTFALSVGVIFIVRPDDQVMHWMVGILSAGAIFQCFNPIEYWFGSQLKWKVLFIAKIPGFIVSNIIKIGLILIGAQLISFVWMGLFETITGSIGLLIVYQRSGLQLNAWRFKVSRALSLLKDGWPLMLATAMTMVYLRIDQIMLGEMVGNFEVGLYAVAVRLTEIWLFIPTAIAASCFPAVIEAESISKELFDSHLQKLYHVMAFVAYSIAIPIMIGSGWVVKFLYGAAYAEAGPLLAVLIWSLLFASLGEARFIFLLAKNKTRIFLLCISSVRLGFCSQCC
jgi:O-antigen/teichoic acid export membrane protein